MNRTNRTQYPPASGTTTAPPVTRDLTTAVDPTFIPDESDDPQRKSAPRYTLKRPEASAPDQPKPRTTAGPSPPTFKGEEALEPMRVVGQTWKERCTSGRLMYFPVSRSVCRNPPPQLCRRIRRGRRTGIAIAHSGNGGDPDGLVAWAYPLRHKAASPVLLTTPLVNRGPVYSRSDLHLGRRPPGADSLGVSTAA